jgi:transcriptional regulator with XRE-family HTH domain
MPSTGPARRALSGRLRDLLAQRQLRQADLAEALSVSQPYVSHLLAGKRGISIDRLDHLARALNVRLPELFAEPVEGDYPISLSPMELELVRKWRAAPPGARRAVTAVLDLQENDVDSENPFDFLGGRPHTPEDAKEEGEGQNERRTTERQSAAATKRGLNRMLAELTRAIESLRLPDDEPPQERRPTNRPRNVTK